MLKLLTILMGDIVNHEIDLSKYQLRTDLAIDAIGSKKIDGIDSDLMEITLPDVSDSNPDTTNLQKDSWTCFFLPFTVDSSDINKFMNFRFTHKAVNTVEGNSTLWIDALNLQLNDRNESFTPFSYVKPSNVVKQFSTIDFDSVLDGAVNTKTISFPFAKPYNKVDVVPTPAISATGCTFSAYCSVDSSIVVTCRNNTGATVDLPSEDYNIIVTK